GERGHADLDEQLVLLQRRLHEALEPVVHLHRALLLALADELGAERDHGGGHVGGGIAVGQRAADRSLVAHGGVAGHGRGLRHAGGGVILERGWVHGRLLYRFGPAAPAVLAAWMVFHTRSGESGIVSM